MHIDRVVQLHQKKKEISLLSNSSIFLNSCTQVIVTSKSINCTPV